MNGSYTSSISLHDVSVDDGQSALDNSSRASSPFDILTPQDVIPIETARSRFLDLVVDYFICEHVIEMVECSGSDCSQVDGKSNKRKQQEVRYEGDPRVALPLMYIANLYETLVSDVNVRLAALIGFHEKTIGLALEASGGLYRKLTQRFPKRGHCSFKRRELATSHATRTKFPELVVQEEKRVRFVVINGLAIVERPENMRMEDAEWFKRLTGRSEVAICSRDYKFYSPRHKIRRSPQAAFDIPDTSALAEDENSSLRCVSELRDRVARGGDPTLLHEPPIYEDMPEGEPDGTAPEDPIFGTEAPLSDNHVTDPVQGDADQPMESNDVDPMEEDLLNEIYEKAADEPWIPAGEGTNKEIPEPSAPKEVNSMVQKPQDGAASDGPKPAKIELTEEQKARMEANRLKALERAAARARASQPT